MQKSPCNAPLLVLPHSVPALTSLFLSTNHCLCHLTDMLGNPSPPESIIRNSTSLPATRLSQLFPQGAPWMCSFLRTLPHVSSPQLPMSLGDKLLLCPELAKDHPNSVPSSLPGLALLFLRCPKHTDIPQLSCCKEDASWGALVLASVKSPWNLISKVFLNILHKIATSWVWWWAPVIPTLKRQKQKDRSSRSASATQFEDDLDYEILFQTQANK